MIWVIIGNMRLSGMLLLVPVAVAFAGDWPQWRGPNRDGVAETDAPVSWSESNITWKTDIPGRGFATPVIAGERIIVTTAIPLSQASSQSDGRRTGPGGGAGAGVEQQLVVMALDRASGKLLWKQVAKTVMPHEGYHQRYGSFASYAPITDGKHVWALFGSYGIYCYTLDGKLIWSKDLPSMSMRMAFGEGGSPALAGSKLILSLDQESGSYIMVLDKVTGKEIWRKDRDEISSWSTPYVLKSGDRDLIIVSATKRVRAYDLETGEVVWECAGLGANVIPAPVVHKDIVIVMSGFRDPNLLAIRLGGRGDLTGSSSIVWTNQRGNSYTASPVIQDGKLYVLTDSGTLSCFNAATGEVYYRQQRLPKAYNFKASPVSAGGKLYLATEEGDVVVVKAGEQFEVLATNSMPDQSFISSPVIVDETLYLRSQNTLFCIRKN